MRIRNVILAVVAIAASVAIGMRLGSRNYIAVIGGGGSEQDQNKVTRLMRMISTDYIDSVSLDSITEVIMPELMSVLDPHSVYIPAKDFAAVRESLTGEGFAGVGVRFSMIIDTAVITNVIPGGPSDKAGLHNGDRIMRIDTTDIAGIGFPDMKVIEMLRGKLGTTVELGIERKGEPMTINVTRGQIPVNSVAAAFMIEPGIAYIKLEQFSRTTDIEVREALSQLRRQGAKKVVLDLRGNQGGYLEQAINLSNEFLAEGSMIVYTEDRQGERQEWHSDGHGKFMDMDIAVVVDQLSASSSEIVAGALQDNDRGVIVGRRTFGKGLVQEQVAFNDGSAVRLTVARYYTPTGRSIQKPYDDQLAYYMETYERQGEYFSADSVHFADSLRFTTPGGRTVYGGGGIMPDVFVPLDTIYMNKFWVEVQITDLPYRFALHWADVHRDRVNAVNTVEELDALLDGDPELWPEFLKFARQRAGIVPAPNDKDVTKDALIRLIRANIGRGTVLDGAGFISQYYPEDEPLTAAVEKLSKKK